MDVTDALNKGRSLVAAAIFVTSGILALYSE
jgi:hypothetical protein